MLSFAKPTQNQTFRMQFMGTLENINVNKDLPVTYLNYIPWQPENEDGVLPYNKF